MVLVYEAGYSGFWLARWLARHGVEAFVVQPSSVPVRTAGCAGPSPTGSMLSCCCARCSPGCAGSRAFCSMVPIPTEADEDARRCVRERQDLAG